jgi:multiple sugar transport system permease protein
MQVNPREWFRNLERGWQNPIKRQRRLFVWLSLIPILAHFGFFMINPIVSALNVSLRKWRLQERDHPFIAFDNYSWALHDDQFWVSMKNTLSFTVVHIALSVILGLLLAVIIFSLLQPWRGILTTAYFLPVMTSMVVVSFIFRDLFSPVTGPLNYLLHFIGLGPYNYLSSSSVAMPSMIGVTTWKALGFYVVLFMAGLTTIPAEFLEAAAIDGASKFQSFIHITLPLLRPTLVYVLVTGTIASLQIFTQVFILTRGGPGSATRTLVIHIYENGFTFFNLGRASAIAFLLFILIMAVSLAYLRVLREQFEY